MAITWDIKITPLNVERYEASVLATRTDSLDPTNVETHNIITCLLQTEAQKLAVLENLWASHLTWGERQAAIDAYVGDLETQAKIILEGRE